MATTSPTSSRQSPSKPTKPRVRTTNSRWWSNPNPKWSSSRIDTATTTWLTIKPRCVPGAAAWNCCAASSCDLAFPSVRINRYHIIYNPKNTVTCFSCGITHAACGPCAASLPKLLWTIVTGRSCSSCGRLRLRGSCCEMAGGSSRRGTCSRTTCRLRIAFTRWNWLIESIFRSPCPTRPRIRMSGCLSESPLVVSHRSF